jgi:hypothetical protein
VTTGTERGGVSNVDMDGNNTLQIKAIKVAIATFEIRPEVYICSNLVRFPKRF